MHVSELGLEFIARWEGCVLHPYNDAAKPPNATIGVGHMIHRGPVTADDRSRFAGFTQADALALLRGDVSRAESAVDSCRLALNQHEYDALCSAAFNLGSVPAHVVRLLRARRKWAAMAVLRLYVLAGGVRLVGLVRRRRAESLLFLKGRYV